MNNNNGITITKPSVIGAGQIGPDILLHFSKRYLAKAFNWFFWMLLKLP